MVSKTAKLNLIYFCEGSKKGMSKTAKLNKSNQVLSMI